MEIGKDFTKSLFQYYQLKLKDIFGIIEFFANKINPEIGNLKEKFSNLFKEMPKTCKKSFKFEKKTNKASKALYKKRKQAHYFFIEN